ncbi:MAG: protein arginine kinase [Symbiobacterium sp.]|uniref:protein arginine kinase n=1 Tax=Symbiobacterium sp. TaxID=1971213 RepID=UPI003463B431
MGWSELVTRASSRWTEGTGPHPEVVLSSRIRLARNLYDLPFPQRMSDADTEKLLKAAEEGVREINLVGFPSKVTLYRLGGTTPLDRQVLVDKHLISPQQAKDAATKAVAISDDESISIMVNEEDHLRIQVLTPGLQLQEAWRTASQVDDALEQRLQYAFDEQLGYLTACPTNVGTGLRASVMMHLPALVLTQQAGRLFHNLSQLGLVVRGLYGEGTEAAGHIFQISNQTSLGKAEEEIISNLEAIARTVIDTEAQARQHLYREMRLQIEDRVSRAYGLLSNARVITSEEAMRLLSDVRLGVALGVLPAISYRTLNELMIAMQPAFLQRAEGRELNPLERDVKRAALIRSQLAA